MNCVAVVVVVVAALGRGVHIAESAADKPSTEVGNASPSSSTGEALRMKREREGKYVLCGRGNKCGRDEATCKLNSGGGGGGEGGGGGIAGSQQLVEPPHAKHQ